MLTIKVHSLSQRVKLDLKKSLCSALGIRLGTRLSSDINIMQNANEPFHWVVKIHFPLSKIQPVIGPEFSCGAIPEMVKATLAHPSPNYLVGRDDQATPTLVPQG